jgi:lipoprotein
MDALLRLTKRTTMIVVIVVAIIACNVIFTSASCTGWTFDKKGTRCTLPLCGPGAVLRTKYEYGYKTRKCIVNGKIFEDIKSYNKKLTGCCK